MSLILWVREEPVEMGGNGFSVQDLQPGRRNLSSGMQPHPVSTGNSGWPLAPLLPPAHFSCKKHLSKSTAGSEHKATHIQTPFPTLSNKQHSLSVPFLSRESTPCYPQERPADRAAGRDASSEPPLLVLRLETITIKAALWFLLVSSLLKEHLNAVVSG